MRASDAEKSRIKWEKAHIIFRGIQERVRCNFSNFLWKHTFVERYKFVDAALCEFNLELSMAEHLSTFYDTFRRNENRVDSRLIKGVFLVLSNVERLFEPQYIFKKIFDLYSNEDLISLEDAVSILSIASDELDNDMLCKLHKVSPSKVLSANGLRKIFAEDSTILLTFKDKIFGRIEDDLRVLLLSKKEKISFDIVQKKLRNIKVDLIHQRKATLLMRKCFYNWKRERVIHKRRWILHFVAKRRLQHWKENYEMNAALCKREEYATAIGQLAVKRKVFSRIYKHSEDTKRLRLLDRKAQIPKNAAAGLGLIRIFLSRFMLTKCFDKWYVWVKFSKQLENAAAHHDHYLKQKFFECFRKNVVQIKLKKEQIRISHKNKEPEPEHEICFVQKEKPLYHFEPVPKIKKTRQIYRKRPLKKSRTSSKFVHLVKQYTEELNMEKKRALEVHKKKFSKWIRSRKGKDVLRKEHKRLQQFLLSPHQIDESIDLMLTSTANIAFAMIDATLSGSGHLSEEFMQHVPCQNNINASNIYQILEKMYGIILEEDTKVLVKLAFAGRENVWNRQTVWEAFVSSYRCNGNQGTPWKIYVHPSDDMLVVHHILDKKKIYQHKINDRNLKKIAHDNILSVQEVNLMKRLMEENVDKVMKKLKTCAALTIQRHFLSKRKGYELKSLTEVT